MIGKHFFNINPMYSENTLKSMFDELVACDAQTIGFVCSLGNSSQFAITEGKAPEDVKEFIQKVNDLQFSKEWPKKVRGVVGLEVGITDRVTGNVVNDWRKQVSEIAGNYYVIHALKWYEGQEYIGNVPLTEKRVDFIINALKEAAATKEIKYLAMPDLFIEGHEKFDELAIKLSTEIAKIAKEFDFTLELNLENIFRLRSFPCKEFWEIVGKHEAKVHIDLGGVAIYGVHNKNYQKALFMAREYNLLLVNDPWNPEEKPEPIIYRHL